MKKAGIIALIILAFFIIYFLQADFFSWFNIFGIMPNLFVILICRIICRQEDRINIRVNFWYINRLTYR